MTAKPSKAVFAGPYIHDLLVRGGAEPKGDGWEASIAIDVFVIRGLAALFALNLKAVFHVVLPTRESEGGFIGRTRCFKLIYRSSAKESSIVSGSRCQLVAKGLSVIFGNNWCDISNSEQLIVRVKMIGKMYILKAHNLRVFVLVHQTDYEFLGPIYSDTSRKPLLHFHSHF